MFGSVVSLLIVCVSLYALRLAFGKGVGQPSLAHIKTQRRIELAMMASGVVVLVAEFVAFRFVAKAYAWDASNLWQLMLPAALLGSLGVGLILMAILRMVLR